MSGNVPTQLRALADRIEGGTANEEVVCLIMGGDDPAIYAIGRSAMAAIHKAKTHLDVYVGEFEYGAKGKN